MNNQMISWNSINTQYSNKIIKEMNITNALYVLIMFFMFCIGTCSAQEVINQGNFKDKIAKDIVVVEFWAKFNDVNAFQDWDKVQGVKYFRVDIAKSPEAKKKYRIRMAPTIIVFNKGIKETTFKAGLDLMLPAGVKEIQESINEINNASKF